MKPILFSTSMVKAILDGTKTMTRRVIRPQPPESVERFVNYVTASNDGIYEGINNKIGYPLCKIKQKYLVNDILWVRETWCNVNKPDIKPDYYYFADTLLECCEDYDPKEWTWKPSIHMPREAARIFLKVNRVYVERLQFITELEAIAEGSYLSRCACLPRKNDKTLIEKMFKQTNCHIHGMEFKTLWDSINAKRGYSWESNPWVWVYEFERIESVEALC